MGRGMLTIAWVIALGLLTTIFSSWEQRQANPNATPQSQQYANFNEVTLQSNRQHHYVATGTINHQQVTFLLDTGASDVVVPLALAQQLRLKRGPRGQAQTANGTIFIYHTRLAHLQLGQIQLRNIKASINPAMNGQEVLLGMSALRHLEFKQHNEQLILRQYINSPVKGEPTTAAEQKLGSD